MLWDGPPRPTTHQMDGENKVISKEKEMCVFKVNIVDLTQTPQSMACDLGLCCLPVGHKAQMGQMVPVLQYSP